VPRRLKPGARVLGDVYLPRGLSAVRGVGEDLRQHVRARLAKRAEQRHLRLGARVLATPRTRGLC